MKPSITVKLMFALLAYNGKLGAVIFATTDGFWDQIDTTKKNMSTFSLQCQDQMVKVESNIYHLDRLRSSFKSGYFEKCFTSEDFKQKNERVLEIQLKNGEVFPAIIDLIHGKKLPNILNKDNYLPLLVAMDQLKMEIDLENFSNFIDHNLASYSLQEAKIFDLYNFIRENSNFEYLLENVFVLFADNLTTLQNHTIFLSLPLDHLIRIINKVEFWDDNKRHKIIQMCTEWLCHDMENRLFHLENLVINIEFAFHFSAETKTAFLKSLPKCDFDKQTKRKIISRCLFALLGNKNLDPERLDELRPAKNLKMFSPLDAPMLKLYNSFNNDGKSEYLLECVFSYFADNLTTLQNHEIFSYLPHDHLIRIIKKVQEPNNENRYEIIQTCTEWLCHDLENRLPHLVNLVTSAKFLFDSSFERNTDVSKCLPKCHVEEQVKRNIVSKCLFALLTDGDQLNPKTISEEKSNYDSSNGYNSEDESESYEENKEIRLINRRYERVKLREFLEKGVFYDITVRVREKSFKLHRIILESKSNYFRKYFQDEYAKVKAHSDGIPLCPSKDKEYVLSDEIDPSAFDVILSYIYLDFDVTYGLIENPNIFVTVNILELNETLLLKCKKILIDQHQLVCSQGKVQMILNFTYEKLNFDDLYLLYLCKHMASEWPDIYNVSHFCSISWTMLESMLKSPHFHLDNHNPDKILDICSKWLSHDTKNRYHFIPQIIKIINPLCVIDHDKNKTLAATKLNDCSQQWVQNKLLHEMEFSLPYIDHSKKSPNTSRKLEEIPVFIAVRNKETIDILNVNLDEIASLHFPGSNIPTERRYRQSPLSAAIIHDNLFIICSSWATIFFEVFNLSSKKRFSLAIDSRLQNSLHNEKMFTLLNYKNEIYCCSVEGWILKYSMKMNRWKMISNDDESNRKYRLRFASDGETLYRMYTVSEEKDWILTCAVETYDFERKLWNSIPNLPMVNGVSTWHTKLTVVNDRDLAVSSTKSVILFHRDSNKWITNEIPYEISSLDLTIFTECEGRMLLLVNNELYQLSPSNKITRGWEFKKNLPLKNNCSEKKFENFRYQCIDAVHRPRLCNNQLL